MNLKAVLPLIAGLGLAGVAGKLGFDYLKKANAAPAPAVELWTPVENIQRGVTVEEQALRPMKFPSELAPKDAIADKSKIVGRVPHTGLAPGVPILDSMLFPPGTSPGVHVPAGFRAVAVKIDESSGVDNHLVPGCHVDVVGYFTVRGQNNKNDVIARTIVENVEVAAVGQKTAPDVPQTQKPDAKDKGAKPKDTTKDKPARAVTLLVKPEQVPILHLAEQRGEIKLSMRNMDDSVAQARPAQTNEAEMLGRAEPKPDADAKTGPNLMDSIAGWFKKPQPAPAPTGDAQETPPVAHAEPVARKFDWVMVIYNGSEQRTFGWHADKPTQPVEMSADGPNLFQDEPRKSDRKPVDGPDRKGGPGRVPDPEPAEPVEPKELIG